MYSRVSLALVLGLFCAGASQSADWAEAMFQDRACDFGATPRGPTLTHHFRLKNNTGKVVTIGNVRVSCGCTSASAQKSRLLPNEETSVAAHMDTSRFSGVRTVTIFVRFDEPQYEEVRLTVTANSREDMSIAPEALDFAGVKVGDGSSRSAKITFYDGGQTKLQSVSTESDYVRPSLKEVRRNDGGIEYELTAKLRTDIPAGKWYSMLWLKTNNTASPRICVPVTIDIAAR